MSKLFKRALGVEHTVIEDIAVRTDAEGQEVLVLSVRADARRFGRCSRCHIRCAGYDTGGGRRRWRAPDVGLMRVYLEAEAPRLSCPEHGVVVAAVPWARTGSKFTRAFEEITAWLCAQMAGTRVAEYLRTTWRLVQAMVTRVVAEVAERADRLAGLRRIGVDEIAYRKGQRYLLIVIDHDTGRLVWGAEGRNAATLRRFFDALGPERAAELTHVSADGAQWIHDVVAERAGQAVICLDAFHVVAWATKALETLRRRLAAELRTAGHPSQASTLGHTRWALVKNPEDLSTQQRTTLAGLAKTNHQLYRGYLIKEQLREIFHVKDNGGVGLLGGLIAWCARCRIPEFVALGRTLRRYQPLILNTLQHHLSNARTEATNTHLRALTKRAYGFRTPEALLAMAMLTRGGCCPPLPGRS
jgi:transposase